MKKMFYGWRIVIAGGAIEFLQGLLVTQAFGAYVAVLVQETNWSKTALSGAAAMQSTESALLGPVLGWMLDRFGPRGVVRVGTICCGIGFMILSQIDTLIGFYVAFFVIALGASMCGNVTISVAIIHWFEKNRARALSAVQFGRSFGGIFFILVAWSIQSFGWRPTAFASGIATILLGWPLTQVIRNRPEHRGENADDGPPAASGAALPDTQSRREFTAGEALRTSAFWLICLGHGFALLVVTAVNVHAITHMKQSLGYSIAEASLFIVLMTMGQLSGVVLGWVIGERFEKRLVCVACMLMHATGLLMLTYATGPVMLVAFALVHGNAWGLRGPFMQAIRADYFGRRSFGMITGLTSLIIVIGQIGGPMVAGAFADWTGDYRVGFTVVAALAGLGSFFFLFAKPPK
ncbi:MAG: MFS transporter [Pseudomonadota bacterium]